MLKDDIWMYDFQIPEDLCEQEILSESSSSKSQNCLTSSETGFAIHKPVQICYFLKNHQTTFVHMQSTTQDSD